jgi:N-acetylglutamate synthase-like GNAT family acetyltransferase
MEWSHDETSYDVYNLMTSPLNVESPITSPYTQIRGAGSALLNYLKMKCGENPQATIQLLPIPNAMGFYQKHGFVPINEEQLCSKMIYHQ